MSGNQSGTLAAKSHEHIGLASPNRRAVGDPPPRRLDDLLAEVLDEGTFASWPAERRRTRLPASSNDVRSRGSSSVVTGQGSVLGCPVAIMATEFEMLGGTIGLVEGEQIRRCIERASKLRLPLIALLASGGIRVQGGATAFMQVAKVSASIEAFRRRGLPFVVYLAGPSFGGAMVACGVLGQVTLAAPTASSGFLGPRIYDKLGSGPPVSRIQRADQLATRGLVDAIADGDQLRAFLGRLLTTLRAVPGERLRKDKARDEATAPRDAPRSLDQASTWTSVLLTRQSARPGLRDLVAAMAEDVTELHGSGEGTNDDPAIFLGLGRIGPTAAVIVGHDRSSRQRVTTAGLQKARRGLRLAAELRLAVVTVVDTPGPELSARTEDEGFVFEVGQCLTTFLGLPVPTLSVLLGEGAGAAALALLPADRVLCAEHAWLGPLSPEGSSVIIHGTASCAPEVAAVQRIGSSALREDGIVDEVIVERDLTGTELLQKLSSAVKADLARLSEMRPAGRRRARLSRYRGVGSAVSDPARHPPAVLAM